MFHHDDNSHGVIKMILAYCTLGILAFGIVGNILSLSVWTRKKLRIGRMAKYMSLLALADLCTLITGIFIRVLPQLRDLNLQDTNVFSCYFQNFFLGFFACISAWTLIVMTIERFVVIAIPLTSSHCLAKCKAPLLISLLIGLSAAVNSPLILINSWDNKGHCVSNELWDGTVKLTIFTLYSPVPVLVLMVLNVAIISKMNRFTKKIEKDPNSRKSIAKKQHQRGPSVAYTDNGGVAMISVRRRLNSGDAVNMRHKNDNRRSRTHQRSQDTSSTTKRQQTVTTMRIKDNVEAATRPNTIYSSSISTISNTGSTAFSDLASISECTTPEEEGSVTHVSLPDLVTENMDHTLHSSSVHAGKSISSADESSVFEQETNLDKPDSSRTGSIPDIALSTSNTSASTSRGYTNQSYNHSVTEEAIDTQEQVAYTVQTKSDTTNYTPVTAESTTTKSQQPILLQLTSNNKPTTHDKLDNLRSTRRRQSHPPQYIATQASHILQKRRSSVALILDQLRSRTSNHLADKYNKLRSKKMTLMLLTVTFSYFMLTTPYTLTVYILVYFSATSTHDHESTTTSSSSLENIYLAQHFLELLLCLNHSINIFLYCSTGSKFRKEFKTMFIMCKSKHAKTDTLSEDHSPSTTPPRAEPGNSPPTST